MYIEVDYNPTPSEMFFISVGLSDTKAISFDYTTKGHRVIKQVLTKVRTRSEAKKEQHKSGSWNVILLKDGKFLKKYHVDWINKGNIDEVNNEVWETIWEKPLPNELKDKLLYYSQLISDNYENLDSYEKDMEEFQDLMQQSVKQYK